MNYSLKAKCQGCAALQSDNKNFTCTLGIKLQVQEIAGNRHSPQPDHEKCYKPIGTQQLREAKKLMRDKAEKIK